MWICCNGSSRRATDVGGCDKQLRAVRPGPGGSGYNTPCPVLYSVVLPVKPIYEYNMKCILCEEMLYDCVIKPVITPEAFVTPPLLYFEPVATPPSGPLILLFTHCHM